MEADKAHYEHLVEVAALAHQRCLAANIACAMRSLYTGDHPTADLNVKNAAMAEAIANEALVDWRARHTKG
jgi:hypothetical protein